MLGPPHAIMGTPVREVICRLKEAMGRRGGLVVALAWAVGRRRALAALAPRPAQSAAALALVGNDWRELQHASGGAGIAWTGGPYSPTDWAEAARRLVAAHAAGCRARRKAAAVGGSAVGSAAVAPRTQWDLAAGSTERETAALLSAGGRHRK
eukprot:1878819-Pleurochrysis_carterae.AAC.3